MKGNKGVNFNNVNIEYNTAQNQGGALYLENQLNVTMNGSFIFNNGLHFICSLFCVCVCVCDMC